MKVLKFGGTSVGSAKNIQKVIEIIKNEYGKGIKITYAQGYNLADDNDLSLISEAKNEFPNTFSVFIEPFLI